MAIRPLSRLGHHPALAEQLMVLGPSLRLRPSQTEADAKVREAKNTHCCPRWYMKTGTRTQATMVGSSNVLPLARIESTPYPLLAKLVQ